MSNIPKIIHYCWFGGKPLPEEYKTYMDSWKKYCPDYEIREWNEHNFDFNANRYCREAYKAKQWAFVSDFARLKIIYENGGIYLDTDVELLKSLDPLLSDGKGYIGFQNPYEVNTGLGFGAPRHSTLVKAMLDVYRNRKFVNDDGSLNRVPCPAANTVALMKFGLITGSLEGCQIQCLGDMNVYPETFFNPLDSDTHELKIKEDTYSIHHYAGTWYSPLAKRKAELKKIIPNAILRKRVKNIAQRDINKIIIELSGEER